MTQSNVNPAQKSHAIGLARQACARVFRDGGAPADALEAFGLAASDADKGWEQAVELIANALCSQRPALRLATAA